MKKIVALLACGLFILSLQAQNLELKDITSGKYYAYNAPEVVSSADGEHYYQAADNNSKVIKYSYKTGQPVETVFDTKTARECPFNAFQGFIVSPDEFRILLYNEAESIYRHSFKAQYYYFDIRRNHVRKLTENKGKQMVPTFSRDGRMAAYVLDNNIWLAKFDYESESQVTKDGAYGKIINGATDWVYEEEFGITSIIDFSADNNLLAFVKFDETEVPLYQMQVYEGQLYPPVKTFKYPKAGEKNSKVSVQVFDINSMVTRQMKVPEQGLEYIPRIQFLPEGDELAIMTLNREQNVFAMYYANARSTVARQILREVNERYIDSELLNSIHFFGNQFAYISEKSGYKHIYLYDNNGVEQKQLTSGNYDVTDLLAIDEEKGLVYYQSAEESPLNRAVYKIELKKGTKTKLSSQKGFNEAKFSKGAKYYINDYSNATTPTVATVHDAAGKQLRVLQDNVVVKDALGSVKIPVKEFITVKAADGITELNAYLIKPFDFNPSRKYPLVMVQYSGPDSQEVQDRYRVDWTNYLATQGFVIACVDGRGTGARGQDFRKCTYQNLGIIESDDQIAAARYFASQSYIDQNKIAIWGWSYGGYNVLMSMSRGEGIFKAGVAIAPVTDWRYYDSVYAERFMRTPQQNMDGYMDGSPKTLARNLQGNLLLIHGSSDDNVHFQNTMEYAKALINADKHFDMFVFPDRDHSIRGAGNRNYLYQKVTQFLKTNM